MYISAGTSCRRWKKGRLRVLLKIILLHLKNQRSTPVTTKQISWELYYIPPNKYNMFMSSWSRIHHPHRCIRPNWNNISPTWISLKSPFGLRSCDVAIIWPELYIYILMDVSKNSDTPKSSILIRCSITNHPFWGTTIFGNTHIGYCFCWYAGMPCYMFLPHLWQQKITWGQWPS